MNPDMETARMVAGIIMLATLFTILMLGIAMREACLSDADDDIDWEGWQ